MSSRGSLSSDSPVTSDDDVSNFLTPPARTPEKDVAVSEDLSTYSPKDIVVLKKLQARYRAKKSDLVKVTGVDVEDISANGKPGVKELSANKTFFDTDLSYLDSPTDSFSSGGNPQEGISGQQNISSEEDEEVSHGGTSSGSDSDNGSEKGHSGSEDSFEDAVDNSDIALQSSEEPLTTLGSGGVERGVELGHENKVKVETCDDDHSGEHEGSDPADVLSNLNLSLLKLQAIGRKPHLGSPSSSLGRISEIEVFTEGSQDRRQNQGAMDGDDVGGHIDALASYGPDIEIDDTSSEEGQAAEMATNSKQDLEEFSAQENQRTSLDLKLDDFMYDQSLFPVDHDVHKIKRDSRQATDPLSESERAAADSFTKKLSDLASKTFAGIGNAILGSTCENVDSPIHVGGNISSPKRMSRSPGFHSAAGSSSPPSRTSRSPLRPKVKTVSRERNDAISKMFPLSLEKDGKLESDSRAMPMPTFRGDAPEQKVLEALWKSLPPAHELHQNPELMRKVQKVLEEIVEKKVENEGIKHSRESRSHSLKPASKCKKAAVADKKKKAEGQTKVTEMWRNPDLWYRRARQRLLLAEAGVSGEASQALKTKKPRKGTLAMEHRPTWNTSTSVSGYNISSIDYRKRHKKEAKPVKHKGKPTPDPKMLLEVPPRPSSSSKTNVKEVAKSLVNICEKVIVSTGTGCDSVIQLSQGKVWKSTLSSDSSVSACLLELKNTMSDHVYVGIEFQSVEKSPLHVTISHSSSITKPLEPLIQKWPLSKEGESPGEDKGDAEPARNAGDPKVHLFCINDKPIKKYLSIKLSGLKNNQGAAPFQHVVSRLFVRGRATENMVGSNPRSRPNTS